MADLDPRQRLLAAMLDDESSVAWRQGQLAQAERVLQRRRRMRACRRLLPLPLGLAAAIAFLIWQAPHATPPPGAGTRAATAAPPAAAAIVDARESARDMFVSTAEILATSPIPFIEVGTDQVPVTIHAISDRELVASLSDRGIVLFGSGPSRTLVLGRDGESQALR